MTTKKKLLCMISDMDVQLDYMSLKLSSLEDRLEKLEGKKATKVKVKAKPGRPKKSQGHQSVKEYPFGGIFFVYTVHQV